MFGRCWKMHMAGCATLVAFAASATAAEPAGSWEMKAPMPAALNEVALAYVEGKVHVLGGSVLGFTGPYHLEYDPAADTWCALSPLPRALDHIGAAALNGKIYAIGGFVGGGVHRDGQNTAFEYDPKLDTWRILRPMKAGRGSVAVVALGDRIHSIGGRAPDGTTVATHEAYDPATNTWKDLAPLPKARDHMAAAVMDGKIHVAGGRFSSPVDRTGLHDVYDAGTNTWTSAPPLPTARSGLAGTLYKGLFLVLGGELPPGHTFPENEAYDAKADSWRTLAPMPAGRHATGAVTDGSHVYLAGGSLKPGSGAVTNHLLVFTLP